MLSSSVPPKKKESLMNHPYRWAGAHKRVVAPLAALALALTGVGIVGGATAFAGSHRSSSSNGRVAQLARNDDENKPGSLGPRSGLLGRDHLTEESAIQVDLSHESVRLPLYPGRANG